MLVFHNRGTVDFTTLGIGVITDIQSLSIDYSINKQPELTASFMSEGVKGFIRNENLVSHNGVAFYIKEISLEQGETNIYTIKCSHASTIVNEVIADISNLFGATAFEVMKMALARQNILMENKMVLVENKDLPDGLEWVSKRFDIESVYKSNIGSVIDTIISKTNGELYIDNFNIAIVKKMGKRIHRPLTLGIDISKLTINQKSDQTVTRLYPLGSGNFGPNSVLSNNEGYIDSGNMALFGFKEAFKDFGTSSKKPYGGASVLVDEAKVSMQSPIVRLNENYVPTRKDWLNAPEQLVDVTNDSMTAVLYKGIMTKHMTEIDTVTVYNLGDIVDIQSIESGIYMQTRITAFKIDLINYQNSTIEFNRPEFTPSSTIGRSIVNSDTLIKMLNADSKFKADFTETSNGMGYLTIDNKAGKMNIEVLVDNCVGSKLFMGNDTQGRTVRTVVGPGLIANGVYDNTSEEWIWSLFMADGTMILGDDTTGVLNTSKVIVRSSTGNLEMKDNTLRIQNKEGIEVIKLGLSEVDNRALFEVRNSIGKKTFWLDDQGNAVFNGTIYGSKFIGSPIDKIGVDPYVQIDKNEVSWHRDNGAAKKRIIIYNDKVLDVIGEGNTVFSGQHFGIPMFETQVLQTKSAAEDSYEIRFCNKQGVKDCILSFKRDGIFVSGPDSDGVEIKLV